MATDDARRIAVEPFRKQLLKWVGNKQRFADEIASNLPEEYGTYFEPFMGSGAVLATLAPVRGVGSDVFAPLMGIWSALREDPATVKHWYAERWETYTGAADRVAAYERIRDAYNAHPNPADFLFISRSCYGGVIRFRKRDGYCSTPCGPHRPIHPDSFNARVDEWARRLAHCTFRCCGYEAAFADATSGDVIYCDPPYSHSQAILYGAQGFSLDRLFEAIRAAKRRGVFVALSIDGSKKTGRDQCLIEPPPGLFAREVFVNCGRSMLRRLQMGGQTLEEEVVEDRLLLTHDLDRGWS